MGNDSAPVHRCTQCAKSYSRRENLVRHYRSAHDNNTPYACPLCPSRFTRSDLLSRHRKVHERESTVTQGGSNGVFGSLGQNEPATPEGRSSSAKRLRQTPNDQHNALTHQIGESSTSADLSLLPRGEIHYSTSHPKLLPRNSPRHPDPSVDQTGLPDWDVQWPFYGEGLNDANIDWTLDFLSQGISTHSPFDPPPEHGDAHHLAGFNSTVLPQDACSSLDGADATQDDELRAWPDQESRPASPRQQRPLHEPPRSTVYVDPKEIAAFLKTHGGHLTQLTNLVSEVTREAMMGTVTSSSLDGFCSEKGSRPNSFPPFPTIEYFMQLYFAHVHARFPVLHIPTFDPNSSPVTLLLAIAIVGSNYSESNQGKFALSYLERTRMSMKLMQERNPKQLRSVEHLLAFFLISLAATWVGQKMAYERAEGDRGELVVSCRRFQLLDCRLKHQNASQPPSRRNRKRIEEAWMEWIDTEQRKRLGLCIYLFDCQVAAFFQRQPYISKAETVNAALPCSETFWNAGTAWGWKALLGPAEIPPSTYFLTTLTTILLYNEISEVLPFPPLDDFCKTLYAYVLHSHVFEWRQTICMLNPTGLLSSPLSLAPQNIGNSLQERQRWLEACLKNWDTNYGEGNEADPNNNNRKSSSGILLYHLAMLALHINFSDLHIVAGRSGSEDDIGLAEQSLRNWLQNERAQLILDRTIHILDASYDAIAAGDAQRSGFELAICLFMSGLTCWAMSRFASRSFIFALQQREIPLSSRVPRQGGLGENLHQHEMRGINQPGSADGSQAISSLLVQVADARDGLRSLKCHRLAVAFGDILDRFLTERAQ